MKHFVQILLAGSATVLLYVVYFDNSPYNSQKPLYQQLLLKNWFLSAYRQNSASNGGDIPVSDEKTNTASAAFLVKSIVSSKDSTKSKMRQTPVKIDSKWHSIVDANKSAAFRRQPSVREYTGANASGQTSVKATDDSLTHVKFHKLSKPTARKPQTTKQVLIFTDEGLVKAAKEISTQRGLVLFTIINDDYLDFAASWLCNTAPFDGVHKHVLFVTTDVATGMTLQNLSSDVTVLGLNTSRFSGRQTFSHAGYLRIMVERTRYIFLMLQARVRLLLFEVDCVWLSDPLPLLLSRSGEVDLIVTKTEYNNKTAGGFLLLCPTQRTLGLWKSLTNKMNDLMEKTLHNISNSAHVNIRQNDQAFLTDLVRRGYGRVRVITLPRDSFADGKWYYLRVKERKARPTPIIINNNYIVGNSAKRRRAQRFGHWYLNERADSSVSMTCNVTAVSKSS
ncbi:uncharacterized protein [Littorina saxatilis]|uniref:uncharacterized protein isoform X2 n=1 Tax=Littorina saxatilis TaxID=31220 RepID=UPI0038B6ADD4